MLRYEIVRLGRPPSVVLRWDKSPWAEVPALNIACPFGHEGVHRPRTQVKVAYDSGHLYVIFHVVDQYVRAVASRHQDPVYKDSCVEFFFTPGEDLTRGYFNLEMNAGGFMLFHFQPRPKQGIRCVTDADCARVRMAHSLPCRVDPEITEPTAWRVEYAIPLDILSHYTPVDWPEPGVRWRANFFKCGDETSHPHWLTWAPVPRSAFGFHVPEAFGTLAFTERTVTG